MGTRCAATLPRRGQGAVIRAPIRGQPDRAVPTGLRLLAPVPLRGEPARRPGAAPRRRPNPGLPGRRLAACSSRPGATPARQAPPRLTGQLGGAVARRSAALTGLAASAAADHLDSCRSQVLLGPDAERVPAAASIVIAGKTVASPRAAPAADRRGRTRGRRRPPAWERAHIQPEPDAAQTCSRLSSALERSFPRPGAARPADPGSPTGAPLSAAGSGWRRSRERVGSLGRPGHRVAHGEVASGVGPWAAPAPLRQGGTPVRGAWLVVVQQPGPERAAPKVEGR